MTSPFVPAAVRDLAVRGPLHDEVQHLLRASQPVPFIRRWRRSLGQWGRFWLPSGCSDERGYFYVPARDFTWRLSSQAGVRPSGTFGTSVTPGTNTKGTAVEIMADLANDAWGIMVGIHNNSPANAAIRDCLVDIMGDPTGGTTYTTTLIPNLLVAGTPSLSNVAMAMYYFPRKIAAGFALAAQAAVNNATPGTVRVWCHVFGKPKRPWLVKSGQYVTDLGTVAATSRGTVIVPGTTAEGAWTSLGTPTKPHWWWQVGMGIADTALAAKVLGLDVGVGTTGSQRVIVEDVFFGFDSGEVTYPFNNVPVSMAESEVPANEEVWGRMQCSAAVETDHSMIAYGCGG